MIDIVLFDLDGTLADDRHRYEHYVAKNWGEYFGYDNLMKDSVWPEAREIFDQAKSQADYVSVLSARLGRNRAASEDWLKLHGLDVKTVILRPETWSDIRPPEFKLRMMEIIAQQGKVRTVKLYDNDPLVVELIHQEMGRKYATLCSWDAKASL